MKKLLVITLAIVSLVFVQCKKANTPEQVTEKFISAVQQNDFEVAKSLADSTALETLNMIESLVTQMGETITKNDSIIPDVTDIKCEDMDSQDMKKCFYTSQGTQNYVELMKIENEWKVVNFPKEGDNEPLLEPSMDITEETDTTTTDSIVAQ
ncbi:MAG: hypothetical protein PWP68_1307 [Rikenellaceae bacterium]|nr:hypothetical protein [Rikenellaceae bacterium]MDI3545890.1 hypothetical protein [Rikenellaceae bacterium]